MKGRVGCGGGAEGPGVVNEEVRGSWELRRDMVEGVVMG